MFSAIKRFAGNKGDSNSGNSNASCKPQSHQAMSSTLQRKFARGVQYNMKIVIKGDRNVGKTCLFYRLQGMKFVEEYKPTEEIQVASIQWNYKATDDIVKVEVWDVVDKGKRKKRFDGLKLENLQAEIPEEPALDAEFLDVYKGTNGVILMMDLTKSWTFDYIQRELPKIPSHIPVMILANHCDMAHHRTVTSDHVTFYIDSILESRTAQVRYSEASMRNGFGLKLLHRFFNLPFLQLQRETLIKQLERNSVETDATIQELDMYNDSDEANYVKFLDSLSKKRREVADSNANIPANNSPSVQPCKSNHQVFKPSDQSTSNIKRSQSGPIVIGAGKPIPYGNPTDVYAKLQNPLAGSKSSSQSSGFISKTGATKEGAFGSTVTDMKKLNISPITSVEEFCPDGGQLDRSFLDDVQYNIQNNIKPEDVGSDSDTDTGNPLVSELQEDFEPDEFGSLSKPRQYFKSEYKGCVPPKVIKSEESSEIEVEKTLPDDYEMKQTNDEFDMTINSEISELTSEAYDAWMGCDTKLRRSPEGGEDNSVVSQTLDYNNSPIYDDSTSVTSSNVHMELLSLQRTPSPMNKSEQSDTEETHTSSSVMKDKKKKDKDKKAEKKNKSKKTKEKDKEKPKDKSSKKRSRDETKSHRDELEEFLNGSPSPQLEGCYEAI